MDLTFHPSTSGHLEQLGDKSSLILNGEPLADFHIQVQQRYDQGLWLEFSGYIGQNWLDYAGPLTLE